MPPNNISQNYSFTIYYITYTSRYLYDLAADFEMKFTDMSIGTATLLMVAIITFLGTTSGKGCCIEFLFLHI
jgi:hypothetical protein